MLDEMTPEEGEEQKKQKVDRQKEYRKRKLDELTAHEQEEQRKRNVDRQKTFRERKLKQLEERRNLNGDAQCGTIRE